MMNSITRNLNIIVILTIKKDWKQFFFNELYIWLTHARKSLWKWLLPCVSQIYSFIDTKFVFDLCFLSKLQLLKLHHLSKSTLFHSWNILSSMALSRRDKIYVQIRNMSKLVNLKVTSIRKLYFAIQCSWCLINDFFYLKKKCFVFKKFKCLCFCKINRFQNLWYHHKHFCIMEVALMLIFFNPKHYQNEIWSNTSVLYDKRF